jgi:hypothetical protein
VVGAAQELGRERGQSVMTFFELVDFEPGRSLTIVNRVRRGARPPFGEVWVSYLVRPEPSIGARPRGLCSAGVRHR